MAHSNQSISSCIVVFLYLVPTSSLSAFFSRTINFTCSLCCLILVAQRTFMQSSGITTSVVCLQMDPGQIDQSYPDSACGDEISTCTETLSSSVLDFCELYGRRYHAYRDGRYALPNDEQEMDRLDIYHAMMLEIFKGKLYLAPIGKTPQRVLDLGTGTGIWAIDFADQHPSAMVIGNDLSPIQPTIVPPNVTFYVDDFEDRWGYESQPFDLIHARYLASSVRDWPRLVRQAFNCTKPGGWVEFQDWDCQIKAVDDTLTKSCPLYQFHVNCCRRRTAAGYSMRPGPSLQKWVQDAGFVNVGVHILKIPLGTWPMDTRSKQIGTFNQVQFEQALEGIAIGMLTQRTSIEDAWSIEEVNVLVAEVRANLKDSTMHGQYDFRCGFWEADRKAH